MQEAFSELESCCYKHVNIQNLYFTSRVNQDLDKYKSKTCQTVILAKEQHAARGDVVFWHIADPSKTHNGKSYSDNITCIDINGYKRWLWNKIKLLLMNTYYFSDDDLGNLARNLLYSSFQFQYERGF